MSRKFTISHADDSPFVGQGLRAFFEYRQMGIPEATGGAFGPSGRGAALLNGYRLLSIG